MALNNIISQSFESVSFMIKRHEQEDKEEKVLNCFVPLELSKIIKDKGFNEPCVAIYFSDKIYYSNSFNAPFAINSEINESSCTAPMQMQVVQWLRDIHGIDVTTNKSTNGKFYGWVQYVDKNRKLPRDFKSLGWVKEQYQALNNAIELALKEI